MVPAVLFEVVAAAIVRDGRVLAARRTGPADVAGGWEFPGGKVDPGETVAEALVREVREELKCEIEMLRPLSGRAAIKPGYELTAFVVRLVSGEPIPHEHDALRWLGPEDLDQVDWLSADRPFLDELRELLLDGEVLPGGNVGGAVRVGPTVRRSTGPWTPGRPRPARPRRRRWAGRDAPRPGPGQQRPRDPHLPPRTRPRRRHRAGVRSADAGRDAVAKALSRLGHWLRSPGTVA
ncbi:MAG: (deoxy)nucleoside triphosphate pyrophosphohydrolase [Nocardioidaceae bacterium]